MRKKAEIEALKAELERRIQEVARLDADVSMLMSKLASIEKRAVDAEAKIKAARKALGYIDDREFNRAITGTITSGPITSGTVTWSPKL